MKKQQSGFTLIELVVVIVILGILAATALPKFVDLSDEANAAALQGVKGAVESASAINYAARKVNSGKGVAITNCNVIGNAMQGGFPSEYTIEDKVIAADATEDCEITQTKSGDKVDAKVTGV